MKLLRPMILSMVFGFGLGLAAFDIASAQPPFPFPGRGPGKDVPGPKKVLRGPGPKHRAPVVVHRDWPLKRAPRPVIVLPPRGKVRARVAPRVFLPPVVFGGVVIDLRRERGYGRSYMRDSLVWQDSETLYREDEWTEFTFDCDARGTKLWFEVASGRVQIDWAEVVFDNGEVQVVEFPERAYSRGIYALLDYKNGRRVDYVRMVAQADSQEAKLALWLEQ